MNISRLAKGLGLAAALFLTAGAFASNKGSLQVNTPVTVNGKLLAAGVYSVMWDGSGPDVQVSFLKGKNVVATAAAHVIDLDNPPAADMAVVKKNEQGSNVLAEIRFGRKKKALALDGAMPPS